MPLMRRKDREALASLPPGSSKEPAIAAVLLLGPLGGLGQFCQEFLHVLKALGDQAASAAFVCGASGAVETFAEQLAEDQILRELFDHVPWFVGFVATHFVTP